MKLSKDGMNFDNKSVYQVYVKRDVYMGGLFSHQFRDKHVPVTLLNAGKCFHIVLGSSPP